MFPFASPLRKSPELRRAYALVLATAEDRIIQANVHETIAFLRSTERELTFENALSIFFRLVGLPERLRSAVTIHALSEIGQAEGVEEVVDDPPTEVTGAVRALARRLRGRRREELRREVENAVVQARARIRPVYIEGARESVTALREIVSPKEAVQHYLAALEIGAEWSEAIAYELIGPEWGGAPDTEPGIELDHEDVVEDTGSLTSQLEPEPIPLADQHKGEGQDQRIEPER